MVYVWKDIITYYFLVVFGEKFGVLFRRAKSKQGGEEDARLIVNEVTD